jgi:hypothetical protein
MLTELKVKDFHYRIVYIPNSTWLNIRFLESVSQDVLINVAKIYDLDATDLWKATRRINLADVLNDLPEDCTPNRRSFLTEIGKFLELSTVWTATKEEMAPSRDKSLAQRVWRTRRVGIFFAKRGASWVFLVLFAPMSATYDSWDEHDFSFCVRSNFGDAKPYQWVADDLPMQDLITNMARNLEKNGPNYLRHILIDVYWGWERYFAQIRNDIRGVLSHLSLKFLRLDYGQA